MTIVTEDVKAILKAVSEDPLADALLSAACRDRQWTRAKVVMWLGDPRESREYILCKASLAQRQFEAAEKMSPEDADRAIDDMRAILERAKGDR